MSWMHAFTVPPMQSLIQTQLMSASAKAAAQCRVELIGKGLLRAENNQPITSELSLCLQRSERQQRAQSEVVRQNWTAC